MLFSVTYLGDDTFRGKKLQAKKSWWPDLMLNPTPTTLYYKNLTSKMKPKVTIGVCVRNSEDSIKAAISSIADQNFPHGLLEIVFVDDGSDDNTLSAIRESVLGMDISVTVYHTAWNGIGHARNVVLSHGVGAYILWVDGDMALCPDYIRKLVDLMDANPELGIAKGKQTLKPMGNVLGVLEGLSRAASRMVDYKSNYNPSKALGTGGSIYRTEMISAVGKFDETLRGYGEDWDFELRARAAGWLLCTLDVEFFDYERQGITWSSLWRRYWLRGYHLHHFLHKHEGLIKHTRMIPPVSFLAGLIQSRTLFKLTRKKIVFLLPFEYWFKTSAWYAGFLNGYSASKKS